MLFDEEARVKLPLLLLFSLDMRIVAITSSIVVVVVVEADGEATEAGESIAV